jgi:PTS system nitrogen regulatory IIA component
MTSIDNSGKISRMKPWIRFDSMPDLLTTRQLAEYLQLSERSVYRLLERGEIPAVKVGGQWRFRKSAVDEWLDLQVHDMPAAELDETFGDALEHGTPAIADLLSAENIFLDLPTGSPTEVLIAFVRRLRLPEPVDRDLLGKRLLEREELCTTALPDGVAVPHTPRTRERLLRHHDLVAVGRTIAPIEFGALDGKPTQIFVLVLARDERAHLVLVARVVRLARDTSVLAVLRSAETAANVLATIAAAEQTIFIKRTA